MPDPAVSQVGLADAIAAVRRNLIRAQEEGQDTDVRFTVGPVEMEFAVDIDRQAGAEASVKVLNLISLAAKGSVSRTDANRVKVTLNPHTINGQPIEVAKAKHGRPGG